MLFGRLRAHSHNELSQMAVPIEDCPDLEAEQHSAVQDEAVVNGTTSNNDNSAEYKFDIHIVFHRSYQQPALFFKAYNRGEFAAL